MTEAEWDEDDWLDYMRGVILGELRLTKRDDAQILERALDRTIDDLPEEHVPQFQEYAKQQLEIIRAEYEAEKASWPAETDSDRLDDVEQDLEEDGILLWQASPCCNTCSLNELPERLSEIDDDEPGFAEDCRGYAFFHDQSLPDELSESTQVSVYLSYGWFSGGEQVSDAEYDKQSLAIGHEVSEALTSAGFKVEWDGDLSKKIRLSLNWQRRTPLL